MPLCPLSSCERAPVLVFLPTYYKYRRTDTTSLQRHRQSLSSLSSIPPALGFPSHHHQLLHHSLFFSLPATIPANSCHTFIFLRQFGLDHHGAAHVRVSHGLGIPNPRADGSHQSICSIHSKRPKDQYVQTAHLHPPPLSHNPLSLMKQKYRYRLWCHSPRRTRSKQHPQPQHVPAIAEQLEQQHPSATFQS